MKNTEKMEEILQVFFIGKKSKKIAKMQKIAENRQLRQFGSLEERERERERQGEHFLFCNYVY